MRLLWLAVSGERAMLIARGSFATDAAKRPWVLRGSGICQGATGLTIKGVWLQSVASMVRQVAGTWSFWQAKQGRGLPLLTRFCVHPWLPMLLAAPDTASAAGPGF